MLQALIQHKLNKAISTGYFTPIEDTLTSSVIGTLQYLPDALLWNLLRQSCGDSGNKLPEDIGTILDIHFWTKLNPEGTYRKSFVEPDIWIETEKYNIIIEAKKSDHTYDNEQSPEQWQNEIISVQNTAPDKKMIFIALGGNKDMKDSCLRVKKFQVDIHTASWYTLLDAVENTHRKIRSIKEEKHIARILADTIEAFAHHHILSTKWLETMHCEEKLKLENINTVWKTWK